MKNRMRIMTGLAVVVFHLAWSGPARAQAQPVPPTAQVEHPLVGSLKDVIEQGVTLYNDKNDPAGCYRVFQGALIAVRPYLVEEPGLLKHVDSSLQNAEKLQRMSDRAFALRAVLDSIRDFYRPKKTAPPGPGPAKKPVETIPDPKIKEKKDDAKPGDKKKDPAKDDGKKKDDPLKVEIRSFPRSGTMGTEAIVERVTGIALRYRVAANRRNNLG